MIDIDSKKITISFSIKTVYLQDVEAIWRQIAGACKHGFFTIVKLISSKPLNFIECK